MILEWILVVSLFALAVAVALGTRVCDWLIRRARARIVSSDR